MLLGGRTIISQKGGVAFSKRNKRQRKPKKNTRTSNVNGNQTSTIPYEKVKRILCRGKSARNHRKSNADENLPRMVEHQTSTKINQNQNNVGKSTKIQHLRKP